MDELPPQICPTCHLPVPPSAYFCPNCGTPMRAKPPDVSVMAQIKIYAVSILLPPFGLIYAWRYYKQPDAASQRIAMIALALTVVMTVATVWLTISAINSFNAALNTSLEGF